VRILVTGGAGYVGSCAARHLSAGGHDVLILDDLSEGHRSAATAGPLVEGSIADRELVGRLLREHRIEGVMHFAGSTYVGVSMSDPRGYWANNVSATLALLETMLDAGVGRIVFSSSCSVYGETASMPLDEDAPLQPVSTYAFNKFVVERAIQDYSRAYGLHYAALRYFNAAGASPDGAHGEHHDPETHLIPLVLQSIAGQRGALSVYGNDYDTPDGTCIRDYVHVEDLARAHESALLRLGEGGGEPSRLVYNLGTGTGSSVLEVIQSAERVTGERVAYEQAARRPGDTARLVAGAERAKRELGWTLEYPDLDAIVTTAWEWLQKHPDGYAD
jgi:UDP-glucose 4-epimerase